MQENPMQILTENLKRWFNHVDVSETSGQYPQIILFK